MRRTPILAMALTVSLILAACGGADDPEVEPEPDQDVAEEEPEDDSEDEDGEAEEAAEPEDLGSLTIAVGAAQSIEFAAASLGLELGVWESRGLDVQNLSVSGGGDVARTMAAGEADIGLTGGPGAVTPIVKGLDARVIAATSLDFVGMVVAVDAASDIEDFSDLEGRTIGFTSFGSLTDFVSQKIAESEGWEIGVDVDTASIGGITELMAALRAGSIDAFTWSPEAGYQLEEEGEARIIGDVGEIVGPNVFEAAYAMTDVIENRPEAVQAYLDGYFEAVQYMKDNQDETIDFMVSEFELGEYAVSRTYDISIDNLSVTGEIPDANLEGLREAVVLLDEEIEEAPDVETFWDPRFLAAS